MSDDRLNGPGRVDKLDMIKSIFPTFAVDVPMPRDTAVPGSYVAPVQPRPPTPVELGE
jgi:hypothetical protein